MNNISFWLVVASHFKMSINYNENCKMRFSKHSLWWGKCYNLFRWIKGVSSIYQIQIYRRFLCFQQLVKTGDKKLKKLLLDHEVTNQTFEWITTMLYFFLYLTFRHKYFIITWLLTAYEITSIGLNKMINGKHVLLNQNI